MPPTLVGDMGGGAMLLRREWPRNHVLGRIVRLDTADQLQKGFLNDIFGCGLVTAEPRGVAIHVGVKNRHYPVKPLLPHGSCAITVHTR